MQSDKVRCKIAGVDEAGRGPLAGPVVAAACILRRGRCPVIIGDSKQMSPFQREQSFAWLTKHCTYGVGIAEAEEIDRYGILAATEKAMQKAVKSVSKICTNLYLLIDGRDAFWFDHPHSSIIRGDESERCISAASIIAKVTRDRLMVEYSEKYPQYGFERHKGYGSREHIQAIHTHGICPLHRLSFLGKIL